MAKAAEIELQPVELEGTTIDAGARLAIVVGQPLFELAATDDIKIDKRYREPNLEAVKQAFLIREAEIADGRGAIPFIVFPEFAIPVAEPAGLEVVRECMEHANGELVFVSGLETITREALAALADRFGAAVPFVSAGAFVNCCVIAVKDSGGVTRWFFQPKVVPSQWEEHRNMACGRTVYYFFADRLGFLVQICFDQIAAVGLDDMCRQLLGQVAAISDPKVKRLDYFLVPQYNRAPSSAVFRAAAETIVTLRHGTLLSEGIAVVAVNRASNSQDAAEFGDSGFHYEDRWYVPSDEGPNGYALTKAGHLTSAIFRKRTTAIHVAELVPPEANLGRPGNPRSPLQHPRSYIPPGVQRTCDMPDCSLRETSTPAGRYVSCGPLPCRLRFHFSADLPTSDAVNARWRVANPTFARSVLDGYRELRTSLFGLTRPNAESLIRLLFLKRPVGNPDAWGQDQRDSLLEWVAALSVLRTRSDFTLVANRSLTATLGKCSFALVDGGNSRYMDAVDAYYTLYADDLWGAPAQERQLVVAVLRSRGHTSSLIAKCRDITEPRSADTESNGQRPAFSPRRLALFIAKELFDEVRGAADGAHLLNLELEKLREPA